MTTQALSTTLVQTESMEPFETTASALEDLRGTVTTAELDLVDPSQQLSDLGGEPDSEIDGVNMPDAQPTPVVPPRPQLKLMNPERPLRYIPIHVWYVFCAFQAKGN